MEGVSISDKWSHDGRVSRCFADVEFSYISAIEVERDSDGTPIELFPQSRFARAETIPLHAYGQGPFCRFHIGSKLRTAGLYVVTVTGEPIYVGECANLHKRWAHGYGSIAPRNCFKGGQQTNCRVNNLVLETARSGNRIELWFRPGAGSKADRIAIEAALVDALQPNWNRVIVKRLSHSFQVHAGTKIPLSGIGGCASRSSLSYCSSR